MTLDDFAVETRAFPTVCAAMAASFASVDIDLWLAPLDAPEPLREALSICLSDDERAAAARFRFEADRARFALRRALTRMILAGYLERDPASLAFLEDTGGKPRVCNAGGYGREPVTFNRSFSDDQMLLGVARGLDIGVDIEAVREMPDAAAVADEYFSPAERRVFAGLDGEAARREGFFCAWTRKEAFAKATGDGLGPALRAVEMAVAPNAPARILALPEGGAEAWTLRGFRPAPGFQAAVAAQKPDATMRLLRLDLPHGG
ncbi:MAG: 4'-phosphopantetheinyl transferase superfamily protein [Pseudomonadota bacterium]